MRTNEGLCEKIGNFMGEHIGLPALLTYEVFSGTYTIREALDLFVGYEEILRHFSRDK